MKNLITFLAILASLSSLSQTPIPGGSVSGTWALSGSPYFVNGDITVTVSQTLIIEPGVEVIFSDHYSFTVLGRLLAQGTETDSIKFTALFTETGWENLYLSGLDYNTLDSTIISYCKFEFINNHQADTGYINIDRSSTVRLSNCLITNNKSDYHGIWIFDCDPLLKDDVITGNRAAKGGGLSLDWASPKIRDLNISDNRANYGGGIYMAYADHPYLSGTRITGNQANFGGGIYLADTYPSSGPAFSSVNLCSIYFNYAIVGTDVYAAREQQVNINMSLDTATVLNPESYYFDGAGRHSIFETINVGLLTPVNADLYVSPSGSDDNDGLTPGNPLKTVARAILTIIPDSSISRVIHLAAGTYSASANDQVFPVFCRHYLNITGTGAGISVLDGEGINQIFYSENVNDVHLSDFSVINGYHEDAGGAIRCSYNAVIYLDSVFFNNCFAGDGGAINGFACQINMVNCHFSENSAENSGGAINLASVETWMDHCIIENNGISNLMDTIPVGGGLFSLNSNIDMVDTDLNNNTAHRGGAIFLQSLNSRNFNGTRLLLDQNYATLSGGGVYVSDDNFSYTISIDESTISHNQAASGGGICVGHEGYLKLSDSKIFGNVAEEGGGAFVQDDGKLEIHESSVYNNSAINGGGFCLDEGSGSIYHTVLRIYTSTLYNNSAEEGGAVYAGKSAYSYYYNVTIYGNNASIDGGGISYHYPWNGRVKLLNAIVRENIPNQFDHVDSIKADYCNIQGGFGGIGSNIIDADPLFANPTGWDFHLTWDNYPIEDGTKSPCIDTGDPGLQDPDGTQSDMGAHYFYHGTHICGPVSGTWTLDKAPYAVECGIGINAGESLTIEPGVEVIFLEAVPFVINGRLIADGTATDTILFHPLDTVAGWGGLIFADTEINGQDSSSIKHCKILYGN